MRDRHDASRALFFGENLIDPDVAIRDPKGQIQGDLRSDVQLERVLKKIIADISRCDPVVPFMLRGLVLGET